MSKTKLKPCPFCGTEAEIRRGCQYDDDGYIKEEVYYFGRCTNIACPKGYTYDTHRKAVRAWNRRAK